MYARIVFVTCCMLIPIYCCSEPSPVLELPETDHTNSARDRRSKSTQDDDDPGLRKCVGAASDHCIQQQHPSNEGSGTTVSVGTGIAHYPNDAPVRP
jgi:hypothetical protein